MSVALNPPVALPSDDKKAARIHFRFLDGLRGLTALYVAFCHTDPFCGGRFHYAAPVEKLLSLAGYGHYAVSMFIVLSGYCLMLPVVRTEDGRLPGGVEGFLKRRARRILPPYYAALILSLLLVALVPSLRHPHGVLWDNALPAFGLRSLLAHVLLIHNYRPEWTLKIDSPMWSIATEWQIYFLFPAFLLPIWRRYGKFAVMAAGFAVGLLPHFLFPFNENLDWAGPWYLGLFALGMAGASFCFSGHTEGQSVNSTRARYAPCWALFAVASFVAFAALEAWNPDWGLHHFWILDTLTGLASVSLVLFCTLSLHQLDLRRPPGLVRILSSRVMVGLGLFSYSFYLVHFPLLALGRLILSVWHLSPPVWIGLELGVVMPLAMLAAYGFHLAFERPFLRHRKNETPAELARDAALSPAP